MGSGEWGMGNGEWGKYTTPNSYSPLPTPHSADAMFIEEVAEIAAVDSEHGGCSGFHAFGREQGFQDDLSLGDLKASFQGAVKRRFRSKFVGQAPNAETPLLLKNDGVFDRVLQFPHVSRPSVIHD